MTIESICHNCEKLKKECEWMKENQYAGDVIACADYQEVNTKEERNE